ncbi:hypothetical protein [Winogradskyella sp. MIT101101]|uniref:hypothetical protein n=1 Tax=Winogradskyella sp. MIT101101 TaxID=3098297 RepID=UPI00399AE858
MEDKIKRKYHIDDLVIELLLQDLEYNKIKPIQFSYVYNELGFEGRSKCDQLLNVLEETDFIKRTDSKNAELTLSGLNVKNMGGWLKYQDYLTKKNKVKKDWYKIISIIVSVLALYLGYLNYDLKKSNNENTQNMENLKNDNLNLKQKLDSLNLEITKLNKELKKQ